VEKINWTTDSYKKSNLAIRTLLKRFLKVTKTKPIIFVSDLLIPEKKQKTFARKFSLKFTNP